jgi:hypothetical protein
LREGPISELSRSNDSINKGSGPETRAEIGTRQAWTTYWI